MLKKQFREFLQTIGYTEEITDELLDELVGQMAKVLEFDNIGNSVNFKTGCILHQLVLKNQIDIRENLSNDLRNGKFSSKLPPLKFSLNRICLNLTESNDCKVLQGWGVEETGCKYTNGARYNECDIAQQSVDQGLNEWK